MTETKYFEKEITLSSGSQPPNAKFPAKLAYWTFGSSSNPAVLLPTCYGGTLATTSPFLYSKPTSSSPDPVLPTSNFFIIVTALLGGGESSSPANTPAPFNGPNFPKTTYEDNIALQKSLCQSLGVNKLFAYIGFSMGGQQAYHMATLYPSFVENIVSIASSARTSWHNYSFLEGPKQALLSSSDFHAGNYTSPARQGLRAFNRVYSTWALSPQWFRERSWETQGFKSLDEYLDTNWGGSDQQDPNGLLALLWTWQQGDIGVYHPEDKGDLGKTLGRIEARCLVMPVRTDQYFPPEDSEFEVKHLKKGELKVIESVWGHLAGGGNGTKEDTEFMCKEIQRFLNV